MQLINGQAVSVPLKTIRSQRTIIMTDETVKELSLLKSSTQENNGLVFSAENGLALSPHTDYNNWQRALKLCGIESKRLHDARHTAATLMYSQGVGIETISRALGHSNSAITSRLYVHSAEEPLRQATGKLQKLLFWPRNWRFDCDRIQSCVKLLLQPWPLFSYSLGWTHPLQLGIPLVTPIIQQKTYLQ